jgi:hypothetical protein
VCHDNASSDSCYVVGTVGEYFYANAYSTNVVHIPLNGRVLQFFHQQIRVMPSIANPRCFECRHHRAVCTGPLVSPALPSANENTEDFNLPPQNDADAAGVAVVPPSVPSEVAHVGFVEGARE